MNNEKLGNTSERDLCYDYIIHTQNLQTPNANTTIQLTTF